MSDALKASMLVAGAAMLLALAPLVISVHMVSLLTLIATTSIITAGLSIATGLAGQITLAQAAFCAFGAYGATLISAHSGLPMWITIPIACLGTGLLGYGLGVLSLRVEGHYLALVTLAFAAIVNLVILNMEKLTGGAVGRPAVPLQFGSFRVEGPRPLYYLCVASAAVTLFLVYNLTRSRWGRAFNALRQSEVASVSLGIDTRRAKAISFAISAGLAAFGGALQSLQNTYLDPVQFTVGVGISYLSVLIIGGLRRLSGAVYGASLFVLLPEFLGGFKSYMGLIFAIVLLLIVLLAPSGMMDLLRPGMLFKRSGARP